ncbi:hypothetical protein PUN28_020721 [Cardiocondyla obscurior]|uniref:Uncharacterized protein n=1 Tax=Cardiocondyla obscurior TaxID=286306 RepID=A0AAW2E720_9HYME
MAKKQKKIFLKFSNVALCGIQNRCIRAYSKPIIFIRSRDMAKKQKKIFFKIGKHLIMQHLKEMHTGLFPAFYFQQPRYTKNKKYFLNFHCAQLKIDAYGTIQTLCIRAYSELFIFTSSRDMAKNEKNILKFCNVALCGIQNRCIRAYSKPSIFTSSRDMAKNEKKYFLILQHSIRCIRAYSEPSIFTSSRDMAKKEKNIFEICNIALYMAKKRKKYFEICNQLRYGQKTIKIFLNYCNIALCGIQNRCIRAYSNRHMAKKRKKYFEIFIVRQLKIDAYGPIPNFLFSPAAEIWPKNEKNILKFGNIALCGI